jgi:hypothetical protein
LYGSNGFFLLAVHLNRSRLTPLYRLNYRVTIVKKQAANIANLAAAAKLLGADFGDGASLLSDEGGPEDLWAGGFVPVDDVPSDITITPEIMPLGRGIGPAAPAVAAGTTDSSGFTSGPVRRGNDARPRRVEVDRQQGDGITRIEERDGAAEGGRQAEERQATEPAPERVAQAEVEKRIAALKEQFDDQIEKLQAQLAAAKEAAAQSLGEPQKFDNEGKYHWDVSVGVPVKKVSDFTKTDTGLDVKTATKDIAFVMLNVYFKPVDVKTPAFNAIPSLLVGFGIEKEPLGRIFVGGGWGPTYANFFGGVAFKKYTEGSDKYKAEVTFGLNVPILGITKRLSEQTK